MDFTVRISGEMQTKQCSTSSHGQNELVTFLEDMVKQAHHTSCKQVSCTVGSRLSERVGTEGCSDNRNVRIIEVLINSIDNTCLQIIINNVFNGVIQFRKCITFK